MRSVSKVKAWQCGKEGCTRCSWILQSRGGSRTALISQHKAWLAGFVSWASLKVPLPYVHLIQSGIWPREHIRIVTHYSSIDDPTVHEQVWIRSPLKGIKVRWLTEYILSKLGDQDIEEGERSWHENFRLHLDTADPDDVRNHAMIRRFR